MGTPFAALESALNTGALAALANATLIWGGYRADGLFQAAYADTLGIGNARPAFRCLSASMPDLAQGESVSVDYGTASTTYTVSAIEPDGTGLIQIILERA
jgi:hypothetical protein